MAPARVVRPASVALACVVAVMLALAAPHAPHWDQGAHATPGMPAAAAATADVSAKFDDGFYDDVQRWIAEAASAGPSGASDGPPARNVMIVVGRTSADGRDPETVASENKDAVARALGELGATDIVKAKSLSFVTATVPLTRLAELAAYGSVYKIGDGEAVLYPSVGKARSTIEAEASDRRLPSGTTLTGRGANVAILDSGIENPALNPKVTKRQHCADLSGCRAQTQSDRIPDRSDTGSTHGTRVAGVLAASSGTFGGKSFPAGIATGIQIFDVIVEQLHAKSDGIFFTSMANALDWAYTNGAHIANLSYGRNECSGHGAGALIVDEAVDRGMVVVGAAGNEGRMLETRTRVYGSIDGPHCSHNPIAVGAVNDRGESLSMYPKSSRGPTKSTVASLNGLLKPDIAAPGEKITLLKNRQNHERITDDGTSYAAPQVSAAAAMLLEAKPSMTPVEVKAALLLGADWQGTGKCTASMYEASDSSSYCSHARKITSGSTSDADTTLLNHVGLGVLDVKESIRYATTAGHVVGDHLASATDRKVYTFSVTDATKPAKVVLAWLSHPKGSIASHTLGNVTKAEISAMQIAPPKLANLNLLVQKGTAAAHTHVSASARQSVEFVHFTPVAGTYTVTVSAAKMGERPAQAFALASTHALTTTQSNTAPAAAARTVTVDPASPVVVRLSGSDAQGDAVSFRVTGGSRGTVSTSEQLTPTLSRVVYTPGASFGTGDTLTATPYDGRATGAAATVTLVPDSPPRGATGTLSSHAHITDWHEVVFRGSRADVPLSFSPALPTTPIRHMVVEEAGADNGILSFRSGGASHKVAAPWGGSRQLDFASPVTVSSPRLTAAGLEDAGEPGRLTVGTSLASLSATCPTPGAAITAPRSIRITSLDGAHIRDNTKTQSTESAVDMRHAGTVASVSVSVDIDHDYRGDLKVALVAPDGTEAMLHNRAGGSADDLRATYTSAAAPLSKMVGKEASGHWRLTAGDYVAYGPGTLNSWALSLTYRAACPGTAPAPAAPPAFSDDFEGGLSKWVETGHGNWRVDTSGSHYGIPLHTGKTASNRVLHGDDCDSVCIVTMRDSVSIPKGATATLTFIKFFDSKIDAGEYLEVLGSADNGVTWTSIERWTKGAPRTDTWTEQSYDISSYASKTGTPSKFKLRFATLESSRAEDVEVDDVVIAVTRPSSPAPPKVTATSYSVYVANTDDREIRAYLPDGTYSGAFVAARSGGLERPWSIDFGPDGNLYVSDLSSGKIRRYSGSTGAPMGSGSDASTNSHWATPSARPYGIEWHGNTLYVATYNGIERFGLSGTSLGMFGDASRTAAAAGAALNLPHDVEFGVDRMYVADRGNHRVAYYSASSGSYQGQASSATTSFTTRYPYGLAWDGASLYQSSGDPGRVNKISPSTLALVRSFSGSHIDEPLGMDAAPDGKVYVANKDTDKVAVIGSAGAVSSLFASRLDDPRDVAVGPRYAAASGSGGPSGAQGTANSEPELEVLVGGRAAGPVVDLAASAGAATVSLRTTDAEGDTVTLSMRVLEASMAAGAVASSPPALTDHGNGTATLTVDGSAAGEYLVELTAADAHGEEWGVYLVRVAPGAGLP